MQLIHLSFLQVYMSSSGLNWKPVVSAWLKSRSPREKEVFQKLFNDSFGVMYNWSTQNLCLTMKVLQANIICQVFYNSYALLPGVSGYFMALFLIHQFSLSCLNKRYLKMSIGTFFLHIFHFFHLLEFRFY